MLRGSEELTRPHLAPAFQASGRSGTLAKPAARSWPRSIRRARLFETSFTLAQLRLFRLDALGEGGGLKALKLESYAPRSPRHPRVLQRVLFPYLEAWG